MAFPLSAFGSDWPKPVRSLVGRCDTSAVWHPKKRSKTLMMRIENVYVLFPAAQSEARSGRQEEEAAAKEEQMLEISQRPDSGPE